MKKSERLLEAYKELEYRKIVLSRGDMAAKIPVDDSYLSSLLSGKLTISTRFAKNLEKSFNISSDWLLTGEGPMFLPNPETEGDRLRREKATGQREQKKVPILGDAAAGTELEINTTDMTYPEQYIDVGDLLRDSEAAFTVYGNSMTPNYPSGSVLGLKRNYDGFIQPGEIYVLETKSNRVFKRLYWNDDKTGYVCISDNTMTHDAGPRKGKYFYEPFEISISEIVRIFDVTGMIKRTRNSGIIQRIN